MHKHKSAAGYCENVDGEQCKQYQEQISNILCLCLIYNSVEYGSGCVLQHYSRSTENQHGSEAYVASDVEPVPYFNVIVPETQSSGVMEKYVPGHKFQPEAWISPFPLSEE